MSTVPEKTAEPEAVVPGLEADLDLDRLFKPASKPLSKLMELTDRYPRRRLR